MIEIGCGDGFRSAQLARRCSRLVGIDPDRKAVDEARKNHATRNLTFEIAGATHLPFETDSFGCVAFLLSLHHIPVSQMTEAIDEAIRVCTPAPAGRIIFVEPGFRGSFFEVDARFRICDGDERFAKAHALAAVLAHPGLVELEEFWDETHYELESTNDLLREFDLELDPARWAELDATLAGYGYRLWAERRINVFGIRAS